jgi:hypothetical protein
MPKISPRASVTEHPLYQATLAAQHAAYQVMRGVPPDWKATAARVHVSLVHATTYAQYAIDPDSTDRAGSVRGLLSAVAEAREQLEPLSAVADANEVDVLVQSLGRVEAAAGPEAATA